MACLEPYIRKEEDPNQVLTLESVIAEGSFGIVYRGYHVDCKDILAIKIIKLEEDETFDDLVIEIDVLSRCHHPNIVGYFGSWRKGDELFIGMELCDGGSAADVYLELHEPFKEPVIALVCREFIKGLGYLHELGIIHRDIKGANILLTKQGTVKLVDFGVSGQLTPANPTRRTFIGTPYWMAPEVIENKGSPVPYNTRADIWSVGITMLEFAHGEPPLSDMHPMRALFQIPYRKPPTLNNKNDWTSSFSEIIAMCLERDPRKRPDVPTILTHPFFKNCCEPSVLAELVMRYVVVKKNAEAVDEPVPPEADSPEIDTAPSTSPPVAAVPAQVAPAPVAQSVPSQPSLSFTTATSKGRPPTIHGTAARKTLAIKQNVNRRFIKQQIQEIKKQARAHQKELDALESKQNAEKQKAQRLFMDKIEKEQRKFQQESEQAERKAIAEKENEMRKQKSEKDEFIKQQQQRFRNWQKDIMNLQRLQQRDFTACLASKEKELKDNHKTQEREEEKRLKAEEGRASKKYMKQFQIENQATVLQQKAEITMLFNHQQTMQKLCDEHREQMLYSDELMHKSIEQHCVSQQNDESVLLANEEREINSIENEFKYVIEFNTNQHKQEMEALDAKFTLLRNQMNAKQQLEMQQHKKQQAVEAKEMLKEFKLNEKKIKLNFESDQNQRLKHCDSSAKKMIKQTLQKEKSSFFQQLTTTEQQFQQKQQQKMAQEDADLLESQQQQTKQQIATQTTERAELQHKHEDAMEKLHLQQYQKMEEVIQKLVEKRKKVQSECHSQQALTMTQMRQERREMLTKLLQQQIKQLKEYHSAAKQLLIEQQRTHAEILSQKQSCAVLAKEKDQRRKKQTVDTTALVKQQQIEMEALKQQNQQQLHAQYELHLQQEATLQQTHQRLLEEEISDTIAYGEALTKSQNDDDKKLEEKIKVLHDRLAKWKV